MDIFSHVLQIFHSNCLVMANSIFAFMLFARMNFVYLNSIVFFKILYNKLLKTTRMYRGFCKENNKILQRYSSWQTYTFGKQVVLLRAGSRIYVLGVSKKLKKITPPWNISLPTGRGFQGQFVDGRKWLSTCLIFSFIQFPAMHGGCIQGVYKF